MRIPQHIWTENGFIEGKDEKETPIFLKRIDTMLWLQVDREYGFATLVRKSEIRSKERHKIMIPKPVRTTPDLLLLLKALSFSG